jgi:hypothetical protein
MSDTINVGTGEYSVRQGEHIDLVILLSSLKKENMHRRE